MVMENWHEKLITTLQLNGKAERTQANYIRQVRILTEHFDKTPDLISEEDFRIISSIAETSAIGRPAP